MISVTLSQLTDILNGELQGADITLDAVTTDTRKLTPGCLFVALKGERFDAHDFADQANAGGAGALLGRRLWVYRSEWGWQDYFFKTGHGTCISDKRHAFFMGKIRNCGITETA